MDRPALVRLTRPTLTVFLVVLMLAVWNAAHARPTVSVAEMPLATVKLYDEQCSRGVVLAQLRPEVRTRWKDGEAILKGGDVDKFCWRRFDDGIAVLSEDGVDGVIPHSYFSPEVK